MPFNELLLETPEDRRLFVYKKCNEMVNDAAVSRNEREDQKEYFLRLVKRDKELSELEKKWCRERFIYGYELENAANKKGKPKECKACRTTRYSDRFCEKCISLYSQSLFATWTSGNRVIDDFIHKHQIQSSLPRYTLEWIPFEQFKNVRKLAEGGFSSIHTADWIRGRIFDYDESKKKFIYNGAQKVVLKCLNSSNDPGKTFFNKALNYCKVKHLIVPCYGVTKFTDNNNYAMVLNHISGGNLRDYLQKNHSKLTLNNRITILNYLCQSLCRVHQENLIHCDLHSGNVLMQGDGCFVADLGLCGPVDERLSGKIYGIVSYIAPEVLQGSRNTKESDIYSVGMLMWEIFAGCPPFDDRAHNHHLILRICEGLRPPILPEMPEDYAQLMQRCWDEDPSERPTVEEILVFTEDKLNGAKSSNDNNNKSFNSTEFERVLGKLARLFFGPFRNEGRKFDSNDNNISNGDDDDDGDSHKSHPLAYHKSRILEDEISRLKNLKSDHLLR